MIHNYRFWIFWWIKEIILLFILNSHVQWKCYWIEFLFQTQTDSKQYFLFNSNHLKHTRTNTPFNLARRICTIISIIEVENKSLQKLRSLKFNQNWDISFCQKCGRSYCGICINILEGASLKSASRNLFDAINGCKTDYIDQTDQPLRNRYTTHRQHIRYTKPRMINFY